MKNDNWKRNYELAKQYYTDNGDLLIPSNYEINGNIKLGLWISHQRRDHKNGKLSVDKIELLEKIGMVWSVFDEQWFEYYDLAINYYNANGNLLIPLLYITNEGVKLGSWISTQRRLYKCGKLSNEKVSLLESIGMVWSVYDIKWYEYYNASVEYYNIHGNLLVPLRYTTNSNMKLGSWISHQRRSYKTGELSNDKIDLLEKIDMVWDGMRATWDEMYKLAQQYYEENNDLSISSTSFTYHNASLGSWIVTQRNKYFKKTLSEKRIAMLNEIGMEWLYTNNPDYVWDKNYNTVLMFFSKYKHLYIPISYVSENGVRIGVWLYDQKLKYERNELSEARKRKLDLLDKTWLEPINTKSSFPEQAVLFYIKKAFPSATKLKSNEISEIDIYIPELKIGIEYDGPSHKNRVKADIKKSQVCNKLGIELIRIRDSVLPNINEKSYKIVLRDDSLEALGEGIIELLKYMRVTDIDVDIKRDYIKVSDNYIKSIDIDWYLKYEKLEDYYNKYGNINVPSNYKTSDGFSLGRWLSNIRSSIKHPNSQGVRLNSNKIELLDKLGMDWSPIETQWKRVYNIAKDYYNKHENLLIPNNYVTDDNIKLGRWISTQRYSYKENKLSEEKIYLLEKIGMIWSVRDATTL